ncbi:HIT family protein [Streptomyces sp. NBC_00385]|uniref:HIT family protein n=1 Tax=Streptomyces sp. NBC_00385 TaxID=2975733 RepID=UPI003FA35A2B
MDCAFCHLTRDDAARWVARGPVASAFAPLNPLVPGHTLVIPTAHWADIFDVPPEDLAHTMALVQQGPFGADDNGQGRFPEPVAGHPPRPTGRYGPSLLRRTTRQPGPG